MTVLFIVICILLFFFFPLVKNSIEVAVYWSKGNVPPYMRYTQDNLTLLYIALAGLLVKKHSVQKHEKLNFLYKYVINHINTNQFQVNKRHRYGQKEYYQEIKGSLIYSINHPVSLQSASKWLLNKQITESHKLLLLKFMADLAYIDKQIHPLELAVIKEFGKLLSVSDRQVNAIVNPLRQEQEKRATDQQQRRKQEQQRSVPKYSERERCCAILGVSKDARIDEIKKSYRKLVLIYHPDKFINASLPEYNSAQKKFLEIQSAYETLEKLV